MLNATGCDTSLLYEIQDPSWDIIQIRGEMVGQKAQEAEGF